MVKDHTTWHPYVTKSVLIELIEHLPNPLNMYPFFAKKNSRAISRENVHLFRVTFDSSSLEEIQVSSDFFFKLVQDKKKIYYKLTKLVTLVSELHVWTQPCYRSAETGGYGILSQLNIQVCSTLHGNPLQN